MSARHHPSDTTLTAYAAGTLSEGAGLVIQAHLDVCPACHGTLGLLEAVGGALVEDLAPADLAADALDKALASLDRPAPPEPREPQEGPRRWLAPGVWKTLVRTGPGRERVYKLEIPAGMQLPRHTHKGGEFLQVLSGRFRDASGSYEPGDFAEADDEDEHRPLIGGDGPCVCLIWTEQPILMRDTLGKVLQPWLGI